MIRNRHQKELTNIQNSDNSTNILQETINLLQEQIKERDELIKEQEKQIQLNEELIIVHEELILSNISNQKSQDIIIKELKVIVHMNTLKLSKQSKQMNEQDILIKNLLEITK
jgi:hypothetical protein